VSVRRREPNERALVASTGLIVVKLGGSVVRSTELQPWLDAIAQGAGRIVVVPGGGALADEVRSSQSSLGFGDTAAHRMALLAMDQLAWAVAGLRPGFEVCDTEAALRDALARRQVAVWAPYALVSNRSDIPQSWTVTSDSLALWLSGRLQAGACYVIKSTRRKVSSISADQLARDEIVDQVFPSMLKQAGVQTYLLGRGDQPAFAAMLTGAPACGASVD
jgi:5-(aminomethyl)-3-furanmethanol phosphate kinase